MKSVGVFLQKGPASLEFLSDQKITKPQDLKGKTVGGTPGDAMYATFPAWLKANGMAASDVKVVNMDPANKIAQLAEGQVDDLLTLHPHHGLRRAHHQLDITALSTTTLLRLQARFVKQPLNGRVKQDRMLQIGDLPVDPGRKRTGSLATQWRSCRLPLR